MTPERFSWPGYDEADPRHRTLQGLLVLDVQYDAAQTRRMLDAIRAFRTGVRDAFEGTGNAYEFECRRDGLFIDSLYEGDALTPVTVDYDVVELALAAWEKHCRARQTGKSRP